VTSVAVLAVVALCLTVLPLALLAEDAPGRLLLGRRSVWKGRRC
jgi:hypothetical protein